MGRIRPIGKDRTGGPLVAVPRGSSDSALHRAHGVGTGIPLPEGARLRRAAARLPFTARPDNGSALFVSFETSACFWTGGTPWERRDAYIENSPFFYLDRVQTPPLVLAGTSDPREAMQVKQTFGALPRPGKRVELRLYRDEDHDPGAWTEASFRDVTARVVAW